VARVDPSLNPRHRILGFITESWQERREQRRSHEGESHANKSPLQRRGALAVTLGLGGAHADGLPGMRGHDHTGITVPDMKEALTFFVDVLGCKRRCLSDRSPIQNRTARS
jgi:hypothetical protein